MNAAQWNAQHPIGTTVIYSPVKGQPEATTRTTRSIAWELGHGAAVVSLTGKAGGVSLDHLKVVSNG